MWPSWMSLWPGGLTPSSGPPAWIWPGSRELARPAGSGSPRWAVLGATVQPGIELILDLVGFAAALPGAGLVITGEGSLDEQTLHGKAPAGVAAAARSAGIPVVAVAGRSLLTPADLEPAGIQAAYALTDLEPDRERCMTDAGPLLERLAANVASDWITDDERETRSQ